MDKIKLTPYEELALTENKNSPRQLDFLVRVIRGLPKKYTMKVVQGSNGGGEHFGKAIMFNWGIERQSLPVLLSRGRAYGFPEATNVGDFTSPITTTDPFDVLTVEIPKEDWALRANDWVSSHSPYEIYNHDDKQLIIRDVMALKLQDALYRDVYLDRKCVPFSMIEHYIRFWDASHWEGEKWNDNPMVCLYKVKVI